MMDGGICCCYCFWKVMEKTVEFLGFVSPSFRWEIFFFDDSVLVPRAGAAYRQYSSLFSGSRKWHRPDCVSSDDTRASGSGVSVGGVTRAIDRPF
jgi:hypothetical protein